MNKLGNKIDFIIGVRNRDDKRVQKCINSFKKYANKIFIVDYNSKCPVKVKDAEVIRFGGNEHKIWNKSFALNKGIKKSKSDYICTIDCDMILNDEILNSMIENLNENTVIFNTNVRRVEIKDISNNYKEMLSKSKLWFREVLRGNIYSSANGGIQVLPRKFINKIGGYDEGLGLYWGAMDNRVFEQAKGLGMTIVDLNIPMLHQEHKKEKENNLDKKEIEFAQKVRLYKMRYLNKLIIERDFISTKWWGGKKPNQDWMIDLVKEWGKNLEIKDESEKLINKKYKVYISVVTNYHETPTYFAFNLIDIIGRAQYEGIEVVVRNPKGNGVDSIRNASIIDAIKNGCTHILQLDLDHKYPEDIIPRLLKHDKEIVCGVTSQRYPPYTQTQFKDADVQLVNTTGNICNFKKDIGLVRIGATGMVGSLIKLDLFSKINYPYYCRKYKILEKKDKEKVGASLVECGEDIFLCRQLSKAKIDIWCDTSLSYPHQAPNVFVDRGELVLM